jgi:hypothetical protein
MRRAPQIADNKDGIAAKERKEHKKGPRMDANYKRIHLRQACGATGHRWTQIYADNGPPSHHSVHSSTQSTPVH